MGKAECFSKCAIFLLVSITAIFGGKSDEPELRLVSVLFRHGDRTPVKGSEMYPKDPNINHNFYPMGYGELTNQGKRRAFDLGTFLRQKYNGFLGPTYTPEILQARSSGLSRTKMSLQLVLAALFPPVGTQIWNKNIPWNPIPTISRPQDSDSLLRGNHCPQFLAEYEKVLNSDAVRNATSKKYKFLMDALTVFTGKKIEKPCDMSDIYQTFMSESFMNLTLSHWAHQMYPRGELLNGTLFCYDVHSFNTQLKRFNGGPLIRKLSEDMTAARNGSMQKGRKLYLYSAHETTIVALFKALDVPVTDVPSYSSAVIVELRNSSKNDYFVKFLYKTGVPSQLTEVKIPGCDTLCPLETFLELTKKVVPSDKEIFCDGHEYKIVDFDVTLIVDENVFENNQVLKEKIIIGYDMKHPLLEKTVYATLKTKM